jgi:hypothetical protein
LLGEAAHHGQKRRFIRKSRLTKLQRGHVIRRSVR